MACCWGEVACAMGHCLLGTIPQSACATSGFPHDPHMGWNGLLSTWQFPLGFPESGRSDLSSAKTKEFLVCGSIPCWLFICHCELPGKGFLAQLRKNLTAELTADSPQDGVCAHKHEKTRSEQNEEVELGSSPETRLDLGWLLSIYKCWINAYWAGLVVSSASSTDGEWVARITEEGGSGYRLREECQDSLACFGSHFPLALPSYLLG